MINSAMFSIWVSALKRAAWLRAGLLIVGWLGIWQLGRLVEYTEHASVWFPAAGLTYAALLVAGARAIPPLMISAVVITIWAGYQYNLDLTLGELLFAGVLFGVAHITPYFLGTRILCMLSRAGKLSLPQLIITFLVSSALVSLFATFLVIGALILSDMMSATALKQTWLPFWIGDLAGVIVLAPIFSGIISAIYPKIEFNLVDYVGQAQTKVTPEFKYKVILTLCMVTLCMLLAKWTQAPESAFAIFFLAIPHMWIACTESALYNTLSLALSSFLIAFWVHVFGLMEFVMVYQFAINVIAANALFAIAIPAITADNRKLREMVFTDSLTQAASRDHFMQRALLEIMRSHSDNKCLSLIVFDIDNFKSINDRYGHAAGDDALRKTSLAAKNSLRPTDVLGRYGGDEFVALLPNSNIDAAQQISERILNALNEIEIGDSYLSSSFGIAELDQSENFSSLFDRADKALYEAKKQGKNRIHKILHFSKADKKTG